MTSPEVAKALLGVPPGRRGSGGSWWKCPFHDDPNPSFHHVNKQGNVFKCYAGQCRAFGGPAKLVMKCLGLSFTGAKDWLGKLSRVVTPTVAGKAPARPEERRSILYPRSAARCAEYARQRIWGPHGAEDLAYLRDRRGLRDSTIEAWRLGSFCPDGPPRGLEGIAIPWYDGCLMKLAVRKRVDGGHKYVELYRSKPIIYPEMTRLQPGSSVVIVEGELDAVLLWQELGRRFAVCTVGSSAEPIRPEAVERLSSCSRLYVATDNDGGGDALAGRWAASCPGRTVRVRPPDGHNDWGVAREAGVNLDAFWTPILKGR